MLIRILCTRYQEPFAAYSADFGGEGLLKGEGFCGMCLLIFEGDCIGLTPHINTTPPTQPPGWMDLDMGFFEKFLGSRESLRGQLVRGGTGVVLVQVLGMCLGLLLSVVLARTLGVKNYGIYAYAMSLSSVLLIFADAGMPTLLIREVARMEARRKWSFLRGLLTRALQINIVTSSLIVMLAAGWLWLHCYDDEATVRFKTILVAILAIPVSSLVRSLTGVLAGLRQVVLAKALEQLARPLVVLVLLAAVFMLFPGWRLPHVAVEVQLAAQMLILGVSLFLLLQSLNSRIVEHKPSFQTRAWLAASFSFALMNCAGMLNSQVDILFLGMLNTPRDVGLYRVAVQGAGLVAFGLNAVNAVVAPQFARLYSQNDMVRLQRLVTGSARFILVAALLVAAVFIFAGNFLLCHVFGNEYGAGYFPLVILASGQVVNAGLGSVGFLLNMTGHERDVVKTMGITAIFNLIANFFFIQIWGTVGAATATALSTIFWNITLHILVRRRIGINSMAFALIKDDKENCV